MLGRRELLASLASLPLLGSAVMAAAQSPDRIARSPIWVRRDRLWMPLGVGPVGPFDFIVDTGAGFNLMSEALVRQLGLRMEGSIGARGIGGYERFMVYKANDVRLGEVQVGTMRFGAFGEQLRLGGAGLISNGLFTAADADFDFDAGEWRLHLDGRRERAGYERLPSQFVSGEYGAGADQVKVEVELDGRRYWLVVDTGAPSEISLNPSAAGRSGLWNDRIPFAPHRRRGIGGDGGAARLVRAQEARIGSLRFERPLVTLTRPGSGDDFDGDGLLGIGILERLNLSSDTRGRRLWAIRNSRPRRPERYGMSGLWLAERNGGLVIEALGHGSPAAEAGLRLGDRIGDQASLAQWIDRLNGRPGETVEIPYVRGGVTATTRLTLREYL